MCTPCFAEDAAVRCVDLLDLLSRTSMHVTGLVCPMRAWISWPLCTSQTHMRESSDDEIRYLFFLPSATSTQMRLRTMSLCPPSSRYWSSSKWTGHLSSLMSFPFPEAADLVVFRDVGAAEAAAAVDSEDVFFDDLPKKLKSPLITFTT